MTTAPNAADDEPIGESFTVRHEDEPMSLPVFGPEFAKCNECELQGQCKSGRWAPSAPPSKAFNGLMIVGEGPGTHELLHKRPFVGPSGKLLDLLLENSSIDRERTYVTNATLCKPIGGANEEKKGFAQRFPNAIPSCRPRVEAEIEAMRPKGIVAFGAAALVALTGTYHDRVKQIDNPCKDCREDKGVVGSETRKLGPVIKCSVGECDWRTDVIVEGQDYKAIVASFDNKCPKCSANLKRLRPKMIKCPTCGGRKKQMTVVQEFKIEYGLKEAAGGLFIGEQLPVWLREYGVEWVVATWHPAWILRSGKEADDASGKKFGGQFAARAMWDHLEKARRLLEGSWQYALEMEITDRPEDVTAYIADEIGYECDLETNAKSPWDVSEIRQVGIGHPTAIKQLVVDCRNLFKVTVTEHEDRPFEYQIEVLNQPLFDVLRDFFIDPKRPKAGTNFGQYDSIVIWRFFGVQPLPIWADVVSTHHILYPDEPHDLSHVAAEMTFAPHWKEPKAAGGVLKYKGFEELAEYNAKDSRNTSLSLERMAGHFEPTEIMAPLDVPLMRWTSGGLIDHPSNNLRLGHEVSTALVPIAAEMSYMGLPLDLAVLKDVEREKLASEDGSICEKCTHLNCMKARIIDYTKREDFSLGKPADIAWALFDPMGPCKLKPPVITAKGAPSTKKDVLAKLAGAHPLVDEIRIAKATQWIFSNYIYGKKLVMREDGRFHPKWNISYPVTFRWSSEPNCFTGDTEVLTPRGWIRFDQLKKAMMNHDHDNRVAQWKDGKITFVAPTGYVKKIAPVLTLKNEHIDLAVTPDHRCLLRHRKTGALGVFAAKDYKEDWQQIHAGHYADGKKSLDPALMTLLCATQADGSWHDRGVDFKFTKQRKVDRLLAALRATETPFSHGTNRSGQQRIRLRVGPTADWLFKMLGQEKVFGAWVLEWDYATLTDFCTEVMHWDGCFTRMNHYASVQKINAEWVQTAHTLIGKRARIRPREYRKDKFIYNVDIVHRDYSLTTNIERAELAEPVAVYCVSVPSSYLLVRRGGVTQVTGNCQNIPRWLRKIFRPPPGWVIVGADESQLELREMAAISGDPELIRRCRDANEKAKTDPEQDPHAYVAAAYFGHAYTEATEPEKKLLREIAKQVVYANNYKAGPTKIRDTIYNKSYSGPPIELQVIKGVQDTINKEFPRVPKWSEAQYVRARRELEVRSLILNRRREFPLPPQFGGGVEATTACNYPIQSTGADIIDLCTIKYHRRLKQAHPTAWIMAQVHDAVYTVCREEEAEAVRQLKEECYSFDLVLVEGAPAMPFVASGKIGRDWAEVS